MLAGISQTLASSNSSVIKTIYKLSEVIDVTVDDTLHANWNSFLG